MFTYPVYQKFQQILQAISQNETWENSSVSSLGLSTRYVTETEVTKLVILKEDNISKKTDPIIN